jgi:hypothetical protein
VHGSRPIGQLGDVEASICCRTKKAVGAMDASWEVKWASDGLASEGMEKGQVAESAAALSPF